MNVNIFANKKRMTRTLFTEDEDAKLISIMQNEKFRNWSEVAKHFENRNARQVRDRWTNYLNSEINNGPWSRDEDKLLADLYNQYGPKWATISKFFDKRRENNVKNRWYSNIRTGVITLDASGVAKFRSSIKRKKSKKSMNQNKRKNSSKKSTHSNATQNIGHENCNHDIHKLVNIIDHDNFLFDHEAENCSYFNEVIESPQEVNEIKSEPENMCQEEKSEIGDDDEFKIDVFGDWNDDDVYFSGMNAILGVNGNYAIW